ncbi:DUF3667 domain-containing protein [Dysgonomonas sp. ZJ709]|uniref:DUF3667 domain-containing protein n=1 Tax=Dysgonomonas sp. ZJ709 TaxID=2709797 RepID=UPI0013EA1203|nr:DUF3667 domain-containing protein [Dysgonomonas sp. ZJ709]
MAKHCLNCNNIVKGNYCANCGQSLNETKIGWKSLFDELQFSILHINKGIVFTIKELLIRPGSTINGYLGGRRVDYSKPFAYLFILATIYSLVIHFFNVYPESEMHPNNNSLFDSNALYSWYYGHYAISLLLIIPFYAVSSYLIYRKRGYDYIEHLVIHSYISGTKVFILLLLYPLFYYSHSVYVYHMMNVFTFIYILWALIRVFRYPSFFKTLFKAIWCIALTLIFATFVAVVVVEILKSAH